MSNLFSRYSDEIKPLDIYGNPLSWKENLVGGITVIIFAFIICSPLLWVLSHLHNERTCLNWGTVKSLEAYDRGNIIYVLENGTRIETYHDLKSNGEKVCTNWQGKLIWK